MTHRPLRRRNAPVRPLLVRAIAAAAVLLVGGAPPAAIAQQSSPVTLELSVEVPAEDALPPRVVARLSDRSGAGINGARVSFTTQVDLDKPRYASLGTAVTDASGAARINLTPRKEQVTVKARFGGQDGLDPVEAESTLTFPAERVVDDLPVQTRESLLAPVQATMPWVVAGGVGLLWILLIALAVGTRQATRAANAGLATATLPSNRTAQDTE